MRDVSAVREAGVRVSSRPVPIRTWLAILAAGCVVTSLCLAGLVGWLDWTWEKQQTGDSLVATSRAMLGAAELRIEQAAALARGLSVSPSLAQADMTALDREARAASAPYGFFVTVIDVADGRHVVNTQLPAGETPNFHALPGWIDDDVLAGALTVKPLGHSRVTGNWVMAIQLPVRVDGAIKYLVDVIIPASAFQQIVDEQRFLQDWQGVILDSDWTIVARLVEPQKWVGTTAAMPEILHAAEPVTVREATLLNGKTFLTAWVKSSRFGWTASIGIPVRSLFWQSFAELSLIVGLMFAVCLLSTATVGFFTIRLVRSIQTLATASGALDRDEPAEMPRFFVKELADVGEALREAAHRLAMHRRTLEQKIREVTEELRREGEERRHAEAALSRMQRLESLGQLTGGVAHDFNNLLSVITGTAALLRSKPKEDHPKLLDAIERAAARGASLTHQLLSFGRRQIVNPLTIDLARRLPKLADTWQRVLRGDIQVKAKVAPDVWPIRTDAGELELALMNLAINARDAMPNGGRFDVEARNVTLAATDRPGLSGDFVEIKVTDSGHGIPPGVLERIFEPFFTTKGDGQGSGLGLSQVYGFVRQGGGAVTVDSAPGQGTTVSLYLPRAAAEESRTAATAAPTAETELRGRVLLVEDDTMVAEVTASLIEDLGCAVVIAGTAEEALAIIRRTQVDVVVSDVLLRSGPNGLALARDLRRSHPDVPVLLMSGYAAASAPAAAEEGFKILSKPVAQDRLRQELAALLPRSAAAPDGPGRRLRA
jgi:signal transduction histidine kinase/CheY-like chemotaxis protein